MSDLAAVAPAAAPPTASLPSPPTAAPSETVKAPATDTTVTPAATEIPAEAAPAAPVEEDEVFNLDEWDGDVDSLPKDLQHLGRGFHKHYEPKFQRMSELEAIEKDHARALKHAEEMELLFRTLSDGNEDPRVAQYLVERDTARKELEEFKAEVDRMQEEEARSIWTKWSKEHPHLANDAKSRQTIGELLNSGIGLEMIPEVMDLSKKNFAEFRELTKAGNSPALVLETITLRTAKEEKSTPSTAHLVSGAEDPSGNPAAMHRGEPVGLSHDEKLDRAIIRAMRATG